MESLTEEQLENWRKVLAMQIGPAAFVISRDTIEDIRAAMQAEADKLAEEEEDGL